MKQPTIKYPSGVEVNLAAFLLKLTSSDNRQGRRRSIQPERSGDPDIGTPTSHSQQEERHERQSIQR